MAKPGHILNLPASQGIDGVGERETPGIGRVAPREQRGFHQNPFQGVWEDVLLWLQA